ncbi:MAG: RNA-binding domain-containing protein [Candidatus Thorarchaeota archaeon]
MPDNEILVERKKHKFPRLSIENFPPKEIGNTNATILVSTDVRPSEEELLVRKAVTNIFPSINFQLTNNTLFGRSTQLTDLNYFSERLLKQEILDAARRIVTKKIRKNGNNSTDNDYIEFRINKQTAFIGKIVFCSEDESPLGPISVKIVSTHINTIIDGYFPKYEWFTLEKEAND